MCLGENIVEWHRYESEAMMAVECHHLECEGVSAVFRRGNRRKLDSKGEGDVKILRC